MKTFYRIYDPETGELLEELEYDDSKPFSVCYGQRVGLVSEMCGGCTLCLVMQASHYGNRIEIQEERE